MTKRNILIISVGATPQVVTETVYALLTPETGPPFVPDVIHLVTTTDGQAKFDERGLLGENGRLAALFLQYGHTLPKVAPDVPKIGKDYIRDIRTEAQSVAYGNEITRLVNTYAVDPKTTIHVSLAGGRKTMSWYAGAALSLFGRDQDKLSHVLVEPQHFESCDDFWWPTQTDPLRVHHRNGNDDYAAANASIVLADIPFVRLPPILSQDAFPGGHIDYAAIIQALRDNLATHKVRLVLDQRRLILGRYAPKLAHRPLAFYAMLEKARKERWAPGPSTGLDRSYYYGWLGFQDLLDPDSPHLAAYFDFYELAFRGDAKRSNEIRPRLLDKLRSGTADDIEEVKQHFKEDKAKLAGPKGALRKGIPNPVIRDRVTISEEENDHGAQCFGLLREPHQIEIVESE